MSKKFFYNNNHTLARCMKTSRKHIVIRDFSGHWGTICDSCLKEIHGLSPYSIKISDTEIESNLNGKESKEKLSKNSNIKSVEKLMAGNKLQSDFCNTCVGKMEDWRQKFKSKLNSNRT